MIAEYLKENTVKTGGIVMLADLIGSYRVWLMQRGYEPPTRKAIIAALEAEGYQVGYNNEQCYMIVGLSFNKTPTYEVIDGKLVKNKPMPTN